MPLGPVPVERMIVGYSRGCTRCGNSVALQLVGRSAIGADVDWIGIAHREGPPADNRRGVPRQQLVVQGTRRSCQSSIHGHGAGGDERRGASHRSCQSSFHRHGAGGDGRRQRRLPRLGRTMPKIPTQCKSSIIRKLELDGTLGGAQQLTTGFQRIRHTPCAAFPGGTQGVLFG